MTGEYEPTPAAVSAAAVALWAEQIRELGLTHVLPYGSMGERPMFKRRARAALIAAAVANALTPPVGKPLTAPPRPPDSPPGSYSWPRPLI